LTCQVVESLLVVALPLAVALLQAVAVTSEQAAELTVVQIFVVQSVPGLFAVVPIVPAEWLFAVVPIVL
jgi:hypothetical protein